MATSKAEALALLSEGRQTDAAAAFRTLIPQDDRDAELWAGLGHACAGHGEYGEAIAALRRAIALGARDVATRGTLARALFALGHVSEAVRENDAAIAVATGEDRIALLRNQAIIAPGDPATGPARILEIRRRWAAAEAAGVVPLRVAPPRGPKLRLAYCGSFFDRPNWMKMYMGVINAHDRDRFEVNLIVDGGPPSAAAGYREHDEDRVWLVDGVSNAELAGHIAEAGIEVLVDLNGYSHVARLPLLLHRAAPVQIAWNGMFATTGFPHLDALVGDARTIAPGEEAFFTEPLHRVTQTYLPFHVFYDTPPVAPPPCLRAGHVTFGSLASAYKLTSQTLGTWGAVLRACPGSRLLLRSRAFDHLSNRDDLLGRLAAFGIGAERVELRGGAAHAEFLRSYDEIDISLDTFPYNGGTTTVEALWQGVPVLTTVGDRWAGRTSRSILEAAGFGEDVLEDTAALVARAAALARDPGGLAARRATQRARVAASPAANPAAICRELEALYAELAGHGARRP